LLVAGTLGLAVQYPVLAEVNGLGTALWLLLAIVAISEVLYFPSYHTYFATVGDSDARGRQIAVREALNALANVVAPILGTWALVAAGPRWAFFVVGIIQAAAVLPLIGIGNVRVKAEAPGAVRAARLGGALFALDGWFGAHNIILWQAALFVVLGRDFAAYGGTMALAGLVGAAWGLFLGRSIDAGHGRRAVAIAFTIAAALVLFRVVALPVPWLAVLATAAGSIVWPVYLPVLATATYNLAKAAPCPLRFNMALEAAWDVGCAAGCILAAGLIVLGTPLALTLLPSLPAVALTAALLRRYYASLGD
jgi:hypothetical protein